MKRSSILALASVGLVVAVLGHSVSARLNPADGAKPAVTQQESPLRLRLTAEKRVAGRDAQGQELTTWQPVADSGGVQSGDVIRYTVTGENRGNRPLSDLALTEPIPAGTVYLLDSATKDAGVDMAMAFSVDKGKSFAEKPVVNVATASGAVQAVPAPAELYTQVRWTLTKALASATTVHGAYQVQVR